MSGLKRRYLLLPVDYKNIRIVHGENSRWRSFNELMVHIEQLKNAGQAFDTVKPKTWNKHKGTISVCVEWAKTNRTELKTLENNVKALHIKVPKTPKAVKLERDMTPSILLVALLRTPVWSGRASAYHLCNPGRLIVRDSLYWAPLVEIGNGVRRSAAGAGAPSRCRQRSATVARPGPSLCRVTAPRFSSRMLARNSPPASQRRGM